MRDVSTLDPHEQASVVGGPGEATVPSDDDFLFHLHRGIELLGHERVVEAKQELLSALSLQPEDEKGQDLLAGVYFRLGVYPRAIDIWRGLIETHPGDVTLRVNLALALLKTGQPATALEHVREALSLDQDHPRAWGYLGLTHWRLGHMEEAREAFLRGGHGSMALRMEELRAASGGRGAAPVDSPEALDEVEDRRSAMRSAAETAIERFESEQIPLSVAEPAPAPERGAAWRVGEPGEEVVPPRPRSSRPRPVDGPPTLSAALDSWTLALPAETPLSVGRAGELFLQTKLDVFARLTGLSATSGVLRATPVQRRTRSRDLDEVLGGVDPIFRWRGPVAAVLRAPQGRAFHAVSLEDDVLYVLERLVWAFDGRLSFESGTVPLEERPGDVLQLYGVGPVVLCMSATPSAIRVAEGEEVYVRPEALVGWTGRLLPRGRLGGTAPYSIHAPPLSFRGRGVVIVA